MIKVHKFMPIVEDVYANRQRVQVSLGTTSECTPAQMRIKLNSGLKYRNSCALLKMNMQIDGGCRFRRKLHHSTHPLRCE